MRHLMAHTCFVFFPVFVSSILIASAQDGEALFGEDGFYDPDAHSAPHEIHPPVTANEMLDEGIDLHTPSDPSSIALSGYAGFETRLFFEDSIYPRQLDHFQPSLILQPELFFESRSRKHQFRFTPFLRHDFEDPERTHYDIREANWRYHGDGWDFVAGIGKVYWGVTESRHLVDIINQVDAVEDIDEEDKLGQPMLNLNLVHEWGTLSLFAMTGFREQTFPGARGRLRAPLPIDDNDTLFESDLEHWYPEFALRYKHSVGDFDIGAHYFHGTGREPNLILSADSFELLPYYQITNQVGLDLQYTKGGWLWKLEAIGREGHGSPFVASVTGFEYTHFQVANTNADLGFLFEYLYDGRDSSAPPTPFDSDLFAGVRFALNDIQATHLLAGAIIDPSDSAAAIIVEAERRLGQKWKIEVEARLFVGATDQNIAMRGLAQDSFVALRLSRHF